MEEKQSTVCAPQPTQQFLPTTAALSTNELKLLYSKIQCALCVRFPKQPICLSCSHILCQKCVNSLINTALTKTGNGQQQNVVLTCGFGMTDRSIREVSNTNEPKISCPTCSKKYTVSEVADIKPEHALAEVTNFFDEVSEDRPMCSSCLNQRWIVHGSEYVHCVSCNLVICPMCALDGHRSHPLKSIFDSVFRPYREFVGKSSNVKDEWINKLKKLEEAKNKSDRAKEKIMQSKMELTKMNKVLESKLVKVKHLFDKLSLLEAPSYNERTDKLRLEILRSFEQMVQEIRQPIECLVQQINLKADAILHSEVLVDKTVDLSKNEEEDYDNEKAHEIEDSDDETAHETEDSDSKPDSDGSSATIE